MEDDQSVRFVAISASVSWPLRRLFRGLMQVDVTVSGIKGRIARETAALNVPIQQGPTPTVSPASLLLSGVAKKNTAAVHNRGPVMDLG
jgi:hypothetical protein